MIMLAAIVAVSISMGTAYAQSPHFISASATLSNSGSLVVSFKEAGLGTNELATEIATGTATAVYARINKGGNHPQASNKETVNAMVGAIGTFSSGKNGQITASLTVSPPGPGNFSCPSGQSLVLASVSYTNVAITDMTNGVSESIPGTFSVTLVPGI